MQLFLVVSSLSAVLTEASSIPKRAGGPSITPIPANCTIINPLPHAACGTANVNGYMPNAAFTNANLVYSSYFEGFLNQTAQAQECLEQCYGFGTPGTCKSAIVGYNIPTPPGYFGTAGGQLLTACLLYNATMTPNTFVAASSGQYVNETAGNIYCPT